MDTRFWGASGWSMLHLISFSYNPHIQKKAVKELIESMRFVLPCKFCRTSFTEYLEELPIEDALTNKESLSRWMYDIHNKVNEKLRKQGLNEKEDPTFSSVKAFYTESLQNGCTRTTFPGWEFLFSIAENHPLSRQNINTTPMPDAPSRLTSGITSSTELNKYNLFEPHERMPYYKNFWKSIGTSLPFPEWRKQWATLETKYQLFKNIGKRWSLLKTLWKMRCDMEKSFELQNKTKFADLCYSLASHRSGCAKSVRAKTCRRIRSRPGRKTLRH